jgi:hypothetical protein
MPSLYRIKNWQDIYEVNRTRELKVVKWIPVPVKLSGDGYCQIMENKNGPAIFGTFISLIELAASCKPRGDLVRSSGDPHDFNSIGRICRIDPCLVESTILFCIDPLKWIEIIVLDIDCGKTARRCEIGADAPVCSVIPVLPVIPVQEPDFEKTKFAKRSKIPSNINNTAFEIKGQKIAYSFWQSVLNKCNGDRDVAGRIFFRAKCRATGNIIGWISSGMMKNKDGEKYAFKSVREEDEDPSGVRSWLDSIINKYEDSK